MDNRVLIGVLLGVIAVAAGVVAMVSAVLTRRRRGEIADTYASSGGIAYSVLQFGCAGMLMLAGLILIVIVVLHSR
ncbi:MAG: hypothetical protein M3Z13_01790 [Candidatus Dormibacteraeota bacterium]|nr:hypothetical protein [Candidatus Dormibacteraeota bacterium]